MRAPDSQTLLRELDEELWTAADKLRLNLELSPHRAIKPDYAEFRKL